MKTVYGILSDQLGHAVAGGRAWASPASAYLHDQGSSIPIDRDHDGRPVGEIVYLARDNGGRLLAVGHVDDSVSETVRVRVDARTVEVETPLYFSARRLGSVDEGLALDSVALTASPARVYSRPVVCLQGALDHRQAADRWRALLDRVEHELLRRAAVARFERRKGDSILIDELAPPTQATKLRGGVWIDRHGEPLGQTSRRYAAGDYDHEPGRPPGTLRMRPCTILRVS